MISAEFASRGCSALPVDPHKRLAIYRTLTRLLAPSVAHTHAALARRKLFLITSTGRTGTTWLATLLNRVSHCRVAHEPIPAEQCAHVEALQQPDAADDYLAAFRLREIAWRLSDDTSEVYGEVNGALRRHVAALRQQLPQLRVLHIIRHPRDVLMSMLNRGALSESDLVYRRLQRPHGVAADEWARMDRFARLCWLWAADNAYLRTHAQGLAVFEEITRNYSSLQEQILTPLGLTLSESIWADHRSRGRNESKPPDGHRPEWSERQESQFERYCADELAHYACYSQTG